MDSNEWKLAHSDRLVLPRITAPPRAQFRGHSGVLQSRHADQCEQPCGGLHLVNGGEHGGADDSNRAVVITATTCSALGKPTNESVFHRCTKKPQAHSMPTPETSHT